MGASAIDPVIQDTIAIIVRVKLAAALGVLSQAEIDTIWRESARPQRKFVGVGIIPNDEYLVARDGPDNSSPVDPDARVLRFSMFMKIKPCGEILLLQRWAICRRA